jgi:hypothetical protein
VAQRCSTFGALGPGIVDVDRGAESLQLAHQIDHAGVAEVGTVLLEGDAEHQHARAGDSDAAERSPFTLPPPRVTLLHGETLRHNHAGESRNTVRDNTMVLNTSFNENEPVVCKPGEALDCFLRTRMDVLVMGEWVVERREWETGPAGKL